MGTIFRLPNTDFSGIGQPIDTIIPSPGIPLIVYYDVYYTEATGQWTDVAWSANASPIAGILKPTKVATSVTGPRPLPFFSRDEENGLKAQINRPNVHDFTINAVIAMTGGFGESGRYVFDFLSDDGKRLILAGGAPVSYNGEIAIFSSDSGWNVTGVKYAGAITRYILSLSFNKSEKTCKFYLNGSLIKTFVNFSTPKLAGSLFLGVSSAYETSPNYLHGRVGYLSFYEGVISDENALNIFDSLDRKYS